jgi:excisionase family DNA binding protein
MWYIWRVRIVPREEVRHLARQALTATQAAQELNISRTTVLRLFHAGQLRGFRATGATAAHLRIYTESVEAFKALQERQPESAKPVIPPTTRDAVAA